MSTRCSLAYREQAGVVPGYHLWEDAFERLDEGDNAPVYLRLDGVQIFELETQHSGASVAVRLPREFAVALGLLAGKEPA